MSGKASQYDKHWYKGSVYLIGVGFAAVALLIWLVILTILISVKFNERANKFTVNGNMTMNGLVLASNFINLQGNNTALNYSTANGWNANFSSLQTTALTVAGIPFTITPLPNPQETYKTLAHASYVTITLPPGVLQTPPISIPMGGVYEAGSSLFAPSLSGFFGLTVGNAKPKSFATWDIFVSVQEDVYTTCTFKNSVGYIGGHGIGRRFIALPRVSQLLVAGYLYSIDCFFSSNTPITGNVSLAVTFNAQVTND